MPRDPKDEFLKEASAALDDTLRSHGWREIIRPALAERCQNIAAKLARGTRIPEPEVRALQAQFILMESLIDSPHTFLMDGYQGAAERRFS
jgi:hypothetical protein